jgi:Helix-turn-helix domain
MNEQNEILNSKSVSELPDSETGKPVALTVKEKWQGAVTDGSGFVAVPMSLLRLQTKLKLTATDMVVLTNLLAHWWDPARAVYPRSTTIAQRMGVTKRTVQRSTQKMIRAGLIQRLFLEDGKRAFLFDPLVARLARDLPLSQAIRGKEALLQ